MASIRGRLMIDTVRGVIRVRKWPRKRGPPKSESQRFWIDWFKQANLLAKYVDPIQQVRAIEMSKGTGVYPRDVLLMAMRGTLYTWADPSGWKWYSMASIQGISDSLDVLAQTIGSVLVRSTDRWRTPPAGAIDDVLTYKGPLASPVWQAPAGGGFAFAGAQLTKSANQDIVADTWSPITFDGEDYDPDGLHDNVTNNTRMTIPAGWTKVQLWGGFQWENSGTGVRWIRFRKNGADFHGIASNLQRATSTFEQSTASPPVACVAGDYFELIARNAGAGTLYVKGPHNNTYFAIKRVS